MRSILLLAPLSSSLLQSLSAATSVSTSSCSSSPPSLVSTGLRNLGNTCYLNAQLQIAYHIPRVRQLIQQQQDDNNDETYDNKNNVSPALEAVRRVFSEMDRAAKYGASSSMAASPLYLCQRLGINVFQQQDSQEFWKLLLPAVQQQSLLDLYQGAYEDYIVALDGSGHERRREEPFLDLSLNVNNEEDTTTTLPDALSELFAAPELLSETLYGNGWRPTKGAPKVDAHKGQLLRHHGLPSILQCHLKRFRYDWNTDQTSKINAPCHFPLTLDLSPIVVVDDDDVKKDKETDKEQQQPKQQLLYELQGVVVHVGDYGSGHYYSYVRPDVTINRWYRFNDDIVDEVTFDQVCQDAYGGLQPSQQQQNQQPTTTTTLNNNLSDDDIRQSPSSKKKQNNKKRKRNQSTEEDVEDNTNQNIWSRIQTFFQTKKQKGGNSNQQTGKSYGYGGPTSSAYVLQYVRQSEIPKLYHHHL